MAEKIVELTIRVIDYLGKNSLTKNVVIIIVYVYSSMGYGIYQDLKSSMHVNAFNIENRQNLCITNHIDLNEFYKIVYIQFFTISRTK